MIDFTLYYGKISNCGHDEYGSYNGGKAGDQTSTQWQICNWYSRPWAYVFRYPDQSVSDLIGQLAIKAAQNNKIGYDQDQRYTYWEQLKANNYDPSKITVNCETDCSAGVAANVKAVGYLKNIAALKNISIYNTTRSLRETLQNAGFKTFTASKYLTGPDYLMPGDILLLEGQHTATAVGIGKKSDYKKQEDQTTNNVKPIPAQSFNEQYAGTYTVEVDDYLNMRTVPDITNSTVIAKIQPKQEVKCFGYFTKVNNIIWLYVSYKGNEGYCDSEYLKKKEEKTGINTTPQKEGIVTASALYVRTWPGKINPPIRLMPIIEQDTIVEICDTMKDTENKDWYYIRINKKIYGFVNAAYIKVL